MSVKVIATGNILMGDDGIAISVLSEIEKELKLYGIEAIYGETDYEYCLSKIEKGDCVFIIDAAISGKKAGEITVKPIESIVNKNVGLTEHSASLIKLISIYHKDIKGYIIGIEVKNIECSLNLSPEVRVLTEDISKRVLCDIISGIADI